MNKKDKTWIKLMNFGHRMGCHQMEERSFSFRGYQFPVCARCTGVLIGELISIILIILNIKLNIICSFILLLIMGLDWFIQYVKILESNNIRRLLTGISGGIGLTFIYYYIFIILIELVKQVII
ncbi:MAG: DUF2085 domain-containing protein [Clostridia bacterium]|nr:DUF2085 domain-containing protein [Clostridia bacterium]